MCGLLPSRYLEIEHGHKNRLDDAGNIVQEPAEPANAAECEAILNGLRAQAARQVAAEGLTISPAAIERLRKFAATKELGTFTDLEVRDLLASHDSLTAQLTAERKECERLSRMRLGTLNERDALRSQLAQTAWCAKRLLELDEAAAEATGMNLDNTIPGDAIEAAICALNNPGVFAKGSSA